MFLSIIMPCYNSERFVGDTLKMLCAQILECPQKDEIEVICVNDGSTDRTGEIIGEFCKKHTFINLVEQENKGVSCARNLGMAKAFGKYICFMDSDDTLSCGTIDFYTKTIMEHNQCQMFGFGYKTTVKGKDKKIFSYPRYDAKEFDEVLLKQIFLSKKICFHICSCIYESKFLLQNNIRFVEGLKIGEDINFIFRTLEFVQKAWYSSRIGFIYQIRNDSTMQGYKTYSPIRYHSFEIHRQNLTSEKWQSSELKSHSDFWLQNALVSHIFSYLRSDYRDEKITKSLVLDCDLLKRSIKGVDGAKKHKAAIILAKILPMKMILRIFGKTKNI